MFHYKPMKLRCQLKTTEKYAYINIFILEFMPLGHGWWPYWILAMTGNEYLIVFDYIHLPDIF